MMQWRSHTLLLAAGLSVSAQVLAAGNILIWPIDPYLCLLYTSDAADE